MKTVLTLICVLAMVTCLAAGAFAHFSSFKICLDPGHGGSDPGAVAGGYEEEDINLAILNTYAKPKFQDEAATVVMTRTSDVYVSLSGRCSIANNNGCNRFISSHCNAASDTSANGTETFCYGSGSSYSFDLRNKVNPELVSHMGTTNRGVKTASFYVLVYTNMPAILGEVAFITNATDRSKLISSTYQNEAARAYLHGTQSHMGITPHDPSGGVADIIKDNTAATFVGTWSTGTSATDKYGADYRFKSTAPSSEPATWTANITVSGSWQVYAWWTAGANRSPNSAYVVSGNSVYVNQQVNGGQWNSLGAFNLGTGNQTVQKSIWATTGYVVIADAVKWHKN